MFVLRNTRGYYLSGTMFYIESLSRKEYRRIKPGREPDYFFLCIGRLAVTGLNLLPLAASEKTD